MWPDAPQRQCGPTLRSGGANTLTNEILDLRHQCGPTLRVGCGATLTQETLDLRWRSVARELCRVPIGRGDFRIAASR